MTEAPLLAVKNLRLSVRTDEGLAQILDHVELTLPRGKILGVVGESGLRQVHAGARRARHRPAGPRRSTAARSCSRARTCSPSTTAR